MTKETKRTKTKDKLQSIPKEEMDRLGLEVERLMNNEMSYLVKKYFYKYRNATASTFGWTDEDLKQHIMIILWKGVATYDESKNAKMTTYLSKILFYQMANLSKKCQSLKSSKTKMYCPEDLYDSELTTDFTTSEDWTLYSQQFEILMDRMTKLETKVLLSHLMNGESITQMQKKLKVKRPELIGAIKSLKEKMDLYLGEASEQIDLH